MKVIFGFGQYIYHQVNNTNSDNVIPHKIKTVPGIMIAEFKMQMRLY